MATSAIALATSLLTVNSQAQGRALMIEISKGEEKSLNFIEEIVEEDLREGKVSIHSHPVPTGTQWILAYWSCKIHLPEFRTRTKIWRSNKPSVSMIPIR